MKSIRNYIVFLYFFISFNNCSAQDENNSQDDIPHLSQKQILKISEKEEEEQSSGCLVWTVTKGELVLDEILTDSVQSLSNEKKVELCTAILENKNLYHLHGRAGIEISTLLKVDTLIDWLNVHKNNKFNYILLRANHKTENILNGGRIKELTKEERLELIQIVQHKNTTLETKAFFIEALYALSFKKETGNEIYNSLTELNLESNLQKLNDSLYSIYKIYKPQFEELDAIRTWMEMDKKYQKIEKMFKNSHPIMFLQILSFNPSTVLYSDSLSKLKQVALMQIIKDSNANSFRDTYKIAYLIELLIEGNYTVRFLDKIMSKADIQKFRNNLEEI